MTRSNLSSGNRTESTAAAVRMVGLLDIAFPSGTIYANDGDKSLTYNGNAYLPSSVLVSDVSGISETVDLRARRVSIKLSGVDSSLINKLLSDAWHYAEINLYQGFLSEAGALVADPFPLGDSLLMSGASISLDTNTGQVEVSAETLDIFNNRSSAALATPESQKLRYATDTGMNAVRALMELEVAWGGRTLGGVGAGNAGGRPGNIGGLIRPT